jgi:hypothetical protein
MEGKGSTSSDIPINNGSHNSSTAGMAGSDHKPIRTEALAQTPKLGKRRATRPLTLDFAKVPGAPKKDRRAVSRIIGAKPEEPEHTVQCLSYAARKEVNVLKIRSDERGVTISTANKWIHLSKTEFQNLKNVVDEVDTQLQRDVEDSWHLAENVIVKTRRLNNKINVDIRRYVTVITVEDNSQSFKPTRCGVFLSVPQWNEIKKTFNNHTCADTLKESHLGRLTLHVLGLYIATFNQGYEELTCEGCEHEWPSQLDHVCCMQEDFHDLAKKKWQEYLDFVKSNANIHYFTHRLADACMGMGVEITRTPRYLLNKCLEDWSEELETEFKTAREIVTGKKQDGSDDTVVASGGCDDVEESQK